MAGPVPPLRLAMAQLDVVVGDLEGNAAKISRNIEAARDGGAELVLIPEMAVTGYPPEDLLLREHFLRDAREALDAIAADVAGVRGSGGLPQRRPDGFNSNAVIFGRRREGVHRQT